MEEDRSTKFAAVLKELDDSNGAVRPPRRRRVRARRWLTTIAVLAVLGALGAVAFSNADKLLPAAPAGNYLTEKVKRTDLIVSVTEDGTLESSHNIDIKCEVEGGSTILWIIPDGVQVKKGDELVRLDSSVIEDQVNAQKILLEKARAAMIDAEKLYEAAEISVQEYKEGLYLQELQTLEANVTVAKENLESARNALQHTIKMHRKGYVNDLQRDAQAFAVQRSELDLKVAETTKEVLEKFTRAKTLVGLESARDSSKARMASEKAAFELEQARLERLQNQLVKCTIIASEDGMVVYANEQSRRSEVVIEEGTTVRERQTILRLPDLSQMEVKCTVHESRVESLQPGMRARIRIQDRDFQGTVKSVANQAEPSNWFSGNVKEYATRVSIDGVSSGLRPGMTAAVEVLVEHLSNVLSVPVQAVVQKGNGFYCWVKTPQGVESRPVVLGSANNTRIEIKDGLSEGDDVLLNPRAAVAEAREEVEERTDVDVTQRFGGSTPKEVPSAADAAKTRAKRGAAAFSLATFDLDKDGKISRDEAPDRMKEGFDEIDTNKDGFIDASEFGALRRRVQEAQAGAAGGPPGGPGGD